MAHYDLNSLTLSKNGNTYTITKNDNIYEYENLDHFPESGEAGKLYIDAEENKTYRWDSDNTEFVMISSDFEVEDFTGATSSAAGVNGLVPAPSAGDEEKYLKADGTWDDVVFTGAKIITVETTVTNTSGQYSATVNDSRITTGMKPVILEIANPEIFLDGIDITTGNGTVTIACNSVSGTSVIKISFISSDVSSTEYDALDSAKADKVSNITGGEIAGLDTYGNLKKSCLSIVDGKLCITYKREVSE